ncbi:hypothetical protein [Roseivirga sp.]|uniref:hypothetical protein n=1 Tax=Roseivirga sp. TaxID=1964215 RepID=UPI003B8EAE3E
MSNTENSDWKPIDISKLQPGDILIYENQDFNFDDFNKELDKSYNNAAFYVLLYMIAWFDPGKDRLNYKNYYHAAVWGTIRGEKDNSLTTGVVGIGRSGISVGGGIHAGAGVHMTKSIRVVRCNKPEFDPFKLNDALQEFYNNRKHIPYAYDSAYLLAILCTLRYKDGTLRELLEQQLGKDSAWIPFFYGLALYLVNEYMSRHQDSMVVCSTLVSMAYVNADCPLKVLDFESGGNLGSSLLLNLPSDLPNRIQEMESKIAGYSAFPDIPIPDTLVTPRQLLESPDTFNLGYFGEI